MKKVFVAGYWAENLGDDLFLKVLCERYPNTHFSIYSKYSYKIAPNLRNFWRPVYRYADFLLGKLKLPQLEKLCARFFFDYSVILTGSAFSERNSSKRGVKSDRLMARGKHCFVIGSSFGPYRTEDYLHTYGEIFGLMKDVCFRDEYSSNLFKTLPNVRFAPDVVFNLNVSLPPQKDYYVFSIIDLKVGFRGDLARFADVYEDRLFECAQMLTERGSGVVLMSFCDAEGDINAANRILARFNGSNKGVSSYSHKDIDDSLALLATAKGIVATRFHAMILSFVMNKPVFPVIYHQKTEMVMRESGFAGPYVTLEKLHEFDSRTVLAAMDNTPDISSEYITRAAGQFKKLDEVLL